MSDRDVAPMSREAVDHALSSLRNERDRISTSLLDLEHHHGYQLLKGTRLAGQTGRHWSDIQARLAILWRLFDAYQRVLNTAEQLRARHSRPRETVLAELTGLLTGPSVELPLEEIPLAKRTLLGATSERLTLERAVERMTAAYDQAIDLIASVNAAWEKLLNPLEEAEREWQEATRLADSLQAHDPELVRIGRELSDVGNLVRTDPLALVHADQVDMSRLDTVRADLTAVGATLAELARLRDEYGQRAGRLQSALARLGEVLAKARQAYAIVQIKIASPGVTAPADPEPMLRSRLDALAGLRGAGRWRELSGRMAAVDAAIAAALNRAEHDHRLITGLLERRDELRGRLDAYRVKTARLGFAEHDELSRLYEQARSLLWTAPCDLRRCTVVLAHYQRVLRSLEAGTE